MKYLWEKISQKVEAMSSRERVLVLLTLAVVTMALLNSLMLEPLVARHNLLHSELQAQESQQAAVKSLLALAVQEQAPNADSPQHIKLEHLRRELDEGRAYLQRSREQLVLPQKMAVHLRQLLSRNARLQLVTLQTLTVTPLLERVSEKNDEQAKTQSLSSEQEERLFKHGVQLTVRGNYLDLLQYVKALESLPQQMYWAKAQFTVVQYPTSELTLVLYTLSLDKTWLQI